LRQPEHLAAIDLGSNSFHMVVARQAQGEVRVLESLSEKVQLGAGLGPDNRLDEDAQTRALDCLSRFAQRIKGIPRGNVRVVGTNTLRMARNATQFIARAEHALGHDIEVVAGREEARLIYLGVAHSLADDAGARLVVDIGGGSTELIIGERFESTETESLHMGCVSYGQRFFADGKITEAAFKKAVTAARQEVLSIETNYRRLGWAQAVGASGSIKAIAQVCEENGWSTEGISLEGLDKARRKAIKAGSADALSLKGLRDDRKAIFASGLAILLGIFEQMGLAHMQVSSGALREGLLYDLLGRFAHEDVRERSVQALMNRHHVERAQAERVWETARGLYRQAAGDWDLEDEEAQATLRWAALLHEVGLAVSHSQFHKHGAYLVSNSDLPGFSRQAQQAVAVLVRGHRRKLPLSTLAECPEDEQARLLRLCLLLRLACRMHHARNGAPVPPLTLNAGERALELVFPAGWLAEHPLTLADLEQEQEFFQAAGYQLTVTDAT
jgi:exopolyphosphatase/guanosine-5'-triphosphate,3'-diphosphate pyrophosphatase